MTETDLKILAEGHAAEMKLAQIARTRRPTAEETKEARKAYAAAARVAEAELEECPIRQGHYVRIKKGRTGEGYRFTVTSVGVDTCGRVQACGENYGPVWADDLEHTPSYTAPAR